ncbi:MAG TPA: helix-turn-helix domain-containing protein [Marmoricola sp.]|nr:helix-turn-helix domain-containing protein [Marmoricola sp.]
MDLRKREFDVLATLLNSAGSVVTRERLSEEVWDGADEDLHSNSLEVYVSRVRRHLQDSRTVTITTVRGIGYRLDVTS